MKKAGPVFSGALWKPDPLLTLVGLRNDVAFRGQAAFRGIPAVIGTTLNQRFVLEKELGRGGMGAVYRATDQVLGRSVAIKMLKEQGGDEVGKRIRLEAQILARLLHDNVVRIYDFGENAGTYFLVMEEVDGTSYLKRWKLLTFPERLRVIAQVAEALDYSHHQGVIHRDVKPANVLMTAADQPKLSDFGLSLIAEEKDETGSIRGTPHYMSPEQARGKRLDHRTDLYSLGVMLYESATGSVPFSGQALAVIAQHVNSPPVPPREKNREISPELEAIILRLLAKNPQDRFPSGHAVAEALRAEIDVDRLRRSASTVDGLTSSQVAPGFAPPTAFASASGGVSEVASGSRSPSFGSVSGSVSASASEGNQPSAGPSTSVPKGVPPLVATMLEAVLAEPVAISAEERFLCGHYLAYLLGGSRRQGIFLRRPLDPRNADRARLLLAMTTVMMANLSEDSVGRAVELLEKRPDVRSALNPVALVKYLASRDTPAKRKRFRLARRKLHNESEYARANMTDERGLLNPGLMPQTLDDLRLIAPAKSEVDDQLVNRWNRISEVWRSDPDFRFAVLKYATMSAYRDPASAELWPEVVYPLIERARWQRRLRPNAEVLLDNVCAKLLHVPDAGVRLDRAIRVAVPAPVFEKLELSLAGFADDSKLEANLLDDSPADADSEHIPSHLVARSGVSLHELAADQHKDKALVYLNTPDPLRFFQGELRTLWEEALAALRAPGAKKTGHRHVPVGPYRLTVIPSIRGRSAGQVAIQGMPNKQIEMLTPSIRLGGANNKPIIAVWTYQDNSLAISYLDFKGNERYILWNAPSSQQDAFDDPAELNHALYNLGLEAPDQLDRALSKRFRPKNPV